MSLVETINWERVLKSEYPVLFRQVMKGNIAAREEAVQNRISATVVYAAFDNLRFGVEQLTGTLDTSIMGH